MTVLENLKGGEYLDIQIETDELATDPRNEEPISTLLLFHPQHYVLVNETNIDLSTQQAWQLSAIKGQIERDYNPVVIEPVWYYDHSGFFIQAGERSYPFNCQWDAGFLGWAFVSRDSFYEVYGVITDETKAVARDQLHGEVARYDAYQRGEVFAYAISVDGIAIAACGDFYSLDHCREEAVKEARAIFESGEHKPIALLAHETTERARATLDEISERSESYTGAQRQWECYQDTVLVAIRLLEVLDQIEKRAKQ